MRPPLNLLRFNLLVLAYQRNAIYSSETWLNDNFLDSVILEGYSIFPAKMAQL